VVVVGRARVGATVAWSGDETVARFMPILLTGSRRTWSDGVRFRGKRWAIGVAGEDQSLEELFEEVAALSPLDDEVDEDVVADESDVEADSVVVFDEVSVDLSDDLSDDDVSEVDEDVDDALPEDRASLR
jgi:hypothetical protein